MQLSQAATINCETAKALKTWIQTGAQPAVGKRGGGVSGLRVVAHYACRTRNNQPGAKVSEHGRGRAIDIAAVQLADGSEIAVLTGWGTRKDGKALRKMHKAACGPFGIRHVRLRRLGQERRCRTTEILDSCQPLVPLNALYKEI